MEISTTEQLPYMYPQSPFPLFLLLLSLLPLHVIPASFLSPPPQEVLEVAQNILAFLKANCTQEGHTYWLFRRKGEDVVKLYDLTSLDEHKVWFHPIMTTLGRHMSVIPEEEAI